MSFTGRLIHRLAIVVDGAGDPEDPNDLDAYGHAEANPPVETLVWGLVQPRTVEELRTVSQAGPEIGDHVVFLEPRNLPASAYLVDADEDGALPTGRRFDIVGVRDFAFGRTPHLEVDVRLIGRSEAPSTGS